MKKTLLEVAQDIKQDVLEAKWPNTTMDIVMKEQVDNLCESMAIKELKLYYKRAPKFMKQWVKERLKCLI